MAGSNMQKAEFCISPRTVKCYLSRSNLAPLPWQSHAFSTKGTRPPFNRSFGKEFFEPTNKEMRRFEQRTVVITGASRGIGKGIAKRFADEGANLVLAANEASVEAVAEEFRSAGANAVSSVCDVTNKPKLRLFRTRRWRSLDRSTFPFGMPASSRSPALRNSRRTTGIRSWRLIPKGYSCVVRLPRSE